MCRGIKCFLKQIKTPTDINCLTTEDGLPSWLDMICQSGGGGELTGSSHECKFDFHTLAKNNLINSKILDGTNSDKIRDRI